ncbi:MAG: GNAT family N-acetyltransferase [Saezia sp.]
MTENHFINNQELSRYELHISGNVAVADYKLKNDVFHITHVETPPELSGQGVASKLLEQVLTDIKQQGKKVVPICAFAIGYIQKHPQWQPLLSKEA